MSTPPASRSDDWQRASEWIERALGGRIVSAERQPRWRPAWLFDLERDGETVPLYFRGDRGATDHGVYSLEHEMRVLQVLAAHDIPVPRVFGFCPDPRGIVMERCAGRANLATAASEAEREAVLDHYIEILARMHAIDVAPFEAAGLERPGTAEELALLDFDVWERTYRKNKLRPEPAIEFLIRWVRREVPRDRTRVACVCCDSGQFLFECGRVTAVIDLELACLGDPVADLGGMRGRDLSEPLGDLSRAVGHYETLTGEPVDRRALDHHTVRFGVVTPMAVAHLVANPVPGMDLVQYLAWYLVWTRGPLEVIAGRLGIELPPPPGDALKARSQAAFHASLAADFEAYRADTEARLATYRERQARMGPELEAEDLDDAAGLLGRPTANRQETDLALEAIVREATPDRDAALVGYLHRRTLRLESMLFPVMRELEGARIQRIR